MLSRTIVAGGDGEGRRVLTGVAGGWMRRGRGAGRQHPGADDDRGGDGGRARRGGRAGLGRVGPGLGGQPGQQRDRDGEGGQRRAAFAQRLTEHRARRAVQQMLPRL